VTSLTFRYLFDPLCGWCYASAPALADRYGDRIQMMPSGLFAGSGARPIAQIADHATRTGKLIAEKTRPVYSDAYFRDVLRKPDGKFNSGPAMCALVALGEIDRSLEARFLHEVQIARYFHARDTSLPAEVAAVAIAVAGKAGVCLDADQFEQSLTDDETLAEKVNHRIATSIRLMKRLSVEGVPALVMTIDGEDWIIQGSTIYSGGPALMATLNNTLTSHPAIVN
jgi:putative protein-disulfide isomerase